MAAREEQRATKPSFNVEKTALIGWKQLTKLEEGHNYHGIQENKKETIQSTYYIHKILSYNKWDIFWHN